MSDDPKSCDNEPWVREATAEWLQRWTSDGGDLAARLKGRAQFLRDRGEVKSPELMEEAAVAIATLSPAPSDTLERREAIARIIDPVKFAAFDKAGIKFGEWVEGSPIERGVRATIAKADAILALTTSPRIEPIAVATTWSGSATIGDPAMPKVDGAFSISRRRHEDRFTTSPRVDEGRARVIDPTGFEWPTDAEWAEASEATIIAVLRAHKKHIAALATTPADPRVGKIEADLEAAKKALERIKSGRSSVTECATIARSTLSQIEDRI